MKHTQLIFADTVSDPNVLNSPPHKISRIFSKTMSMLFVCFCFFSLQDLIAQTSSLPFVPVTGSGSSSYPIIENAILNGFYEGPEITDPCSCSSTMPNDCFEDEFVILSPTNGDVWTYDGNGGYGTATNLTTGLLLMMGDVIPQTGIIYSSSGVVQYYVYSLKVLVCDATGLTEIYDPLDGTMDNVFNPTSLPTTNTLPTGDPNLGIINPDFATANSCGKSYGLQAVSTTYAGVTLTTGSLCHFEKKPTVTYDINNPVGGNASSMGTALVPPPATPVTVTIDIDGNLDFNISPNSINGINNGKWEILLNDNVVANGDFFTLGPHPYVENIDLMALSNANCGLLGATDQNLVFRYTSGDTRPFKLEDYDGNGVVGDDLATTAALEALERSILNPGCIDFECPLLLDVQWCPSGIAPVVPDLGDFINGQIPATITGSTQYPDDQIQRLTVCPDDTSKQIIRMIFPTPDFNILAGDSLTIYDGTDCSSIRWTNNRAAISTVNNLPNGGWIDASCTNSSGCLTFEFIPDNQSTKGSYRFTWEKRARLAVVTCPTNVTLPSICGLNNTSSIAALYAIPAPTGTCTYVPMIRNIQITNTNTSTSFIPNDRKTQSIDLVDIGDYFDSNNNMIYDLGETIFLPMGNYTVSYEYMEVNGDFTTCNHTVTVSEVPPVCNNQINISLDAGSCSIRIDPDMLIEGDGCAAVYNINVLEGPDAGTDTISYVNLGRLIKVEAVSASGNRCWGNILVEDKAPPVFTCRDTVLFCGISTNPIENPGLYPQDGSDCSLPITYSFSDQETAFGCAKLGNGLTPDTVGMIVRIWYATDSVGTRSNSCTQTIHLLKPKLTFSTIMWPEDTTLYCNVNSSTLPANTGFPRVNLGDTVVALSSTCYFGIDYDDIEFTTDCEGVKKIQRTWRILDWCHAGTGSTVLVDLDPQIIKVLDTVAPIILDFPTTLQFQSDHGTCAANVVLPAIRVVDDCSPTDATYRIIGPSNTLYGQGGIMENVPFGTNEFTYIVEDECGNQRRQSITLEIKDQTPPTAIAGQLSVSLISDTQLTWVYATAFDGGSHDNCNIASILARRVGDVTFEEALGFTCDDIGTFMVEIQVTDECGNIGLAMNEVTITDKLGVCDCNMTTAISIAETSGLTQNDGKICEGDAAILTASADMTVTYAWSTGNTTPSIQATTSGVYQVTITDATNCSVVEIATIEVNPAITATIIATENSGNLNDDVICAGEAVDLTFSVSGGTLPYTYQWAGISGLAPGNTTTESPTISTTYSVTVTDAEGCTTIANRAITVNDLAGSLTSENIICGGASTTLALNVTGGVMPYTYQRVGLTSILAGGTEVITPNATTTYTVIVTDAAGCSLTLSNTVTVNSVIPNLVADDLLICAGGTTTLRSVPTGGTSPYTYSWNGVAGNSTLSVNPTDTTIYQLQVTDAEGCVGTKSITINVPTPAISITVDDADGTVCSGEMVNLSVTGTSGTYLWSTGETTSTITVTADENGDNVYTVTVTDENSCTAMASTELMPSVISPLDVGTINTICPATSIDLTPIDFLLDYEWSTDSNTTSVTANPLTVTPNVTTKYYVTITDGTCSRRDSVVVTVHPSTSVTIVPLNGTTLNYNETTELSLNITSSGVSNIIWTPNTNLSCTNCTNPIFTAPNGIDDNYIINVEITDINGCVATDAVIINVNSGNTVMAALSGKIKTEQGAEVEQTTIRLGDYDMLPALTGATGNYEFAEVPMYDNYTVTPEKNINPLNGVSTFDLVLMSKHILGIKTLDSPYKLIAADINRSGTITAFDMVQLRQLILNIQEDFPNNTSWRFIDAAYEFTDPTNPLGEAIPETYEITDLDTDMTWLDFIAIKIGDLNGSVQPNSLVQSQSRNSTGTLWLSAEPTLSTDGQHLIYHFKADNFQEILGYQFTLDYDPTILEFDRVIPTEWIEEEHFGTTNSENGLLTTSWNTATAKSFSKEETLFSVAFKLKGKVTESDLLAINSNKLQAEAYQEDAILDVQLHQELVIPEVAADKFELYQNRPNPFTGKTTIGFTLPEATIATMRIINTDGRIIKAYETTYEQGYHELIIDSNDLTQYGALYYQLSTPTQIATKKMIYTK